MSIINIKDAPKDWKTNPEYVYIGRTGKGLDGYFGNPFRLYKDTINERGKILDKYVEWFAEKMETDPIFKERVEGLRGKILVCFCAPKLCHGIILDSWANYEDRLST